MQNKLIIDALLAFLYKFASFIKKE